MISKWTKRIIVFLLGCILVVGGTFAVKHYLQQRALADLVDEPRDVPKWTADPRPLQSEAAARKQFTSLNRENKSKHVSFSALKFGVIPGLRGAWSINNQTNKAAFGTDWVPQGLTQSNSKYFISVYDGNHKLNSLIFQIDKKTRKYDKSLILNSMAHVGGITYEDKHRQLIYSDDLNGTAGFGVIKQSTIDAYNPVIAKQAIKSQKIPFALGTRTSAITIYRNLLVVAKYGKNPTHRSIILIPTNKNGLPKSISVAQRKADIQKFMKYYLKHPNQGNSKQSTIANLMKWFVQNKIIEAYYPGWNNVQGVSMLNNGLAVLSQSAGKQPSTILLKAQSFAGHNSLNLDFKNPNSGSDKFKVPHSVEEVSVNQQMRTISMIFESGAKEYRERQVGSNYETYVDRFAILPYNVQVSQ
ncbi:hypothetical protein OXT66_03360 [Lentilactobacillus senioris]|uniref:hypothetical protein n=1 Tax=Lentilactobacillus senioris TaxID=931534 RepID=UPI0022823A32|nr:hypothetical protein [Lentilactobacillus senioris]MCY9806588.1 hypothetical protein [Lentilactobacillus senioris]